MDKPRFMGFDFETFSSADIGSVGSYKYIESPDFEVLLLSYAFDYGEVKTVDFTAGETYPEDFLAALRDPDIKKHAYNCAFERYVLWRDLEEYQPPEQYEDTMILAAVCGLPLSLAGASAALKLGEDTAKMKEGKALIKYFCSPCKATKVNGGRTRNLPEHAPDKWELFKQYNAQDVVAEREIYRRLCQWQPDETEHRFWCCDARINERGMRIDLDLAKAAIDIDTRYKAELTEQAVAISGLDNPKSVSQIKEWLLKQEGIEVPSLNKKVVADVVSQLNTDSAKQFMELRSKLAKTSTAKYEAMVRCACEDEHAKGCFQFYGANRTGRFGGRLVQLQNLPQNHMTDLAEARALVRADDFETVKLLYDNVAGTLSELIRTALIPEPGHRFIVCDFSAIEARIISWVSDQQWRLDVFRNGGDIYCMSASQMFKVPVVKHGENGHLRQKGKVAELACIAENSLVLTDKGLVPIQNVTTDMRLWDGENWVEHDGVIYKGKKEVITYEGLTATPDHLVWVEGESGPIQLGVASSRGTHLVQTGNGRSEIRLGRDNQCGKTLERGVESLLCPDSLYGLWSSTVAKSVQLNPWRIKRLPELLTAKANTEMVRPSVDYRKAEMRKPSGQGIQKLRRAGHTLRLSECSRCGSVSNRRMRAALKSDGDRPHRHEWKLCPRQSKVCGSQNELRESAAERSLGIRPSVLAIREKHGDKKTVCGHDARGDSRRCGNGSGGETQELENDSSPTRVYDIRNAGANHRFTVSGKLVHNCGYGGGVNALKAFGADKMGMTDEEMVETVDLWRSSSPRICDLWRSLEKAAIKCITRQTHAVSTIGHIRFDWEQGIMWMTLPSGRRIAYYGADYSESKWKNGKAISYMGVDQTTKKWERVETWGGKLTENLVQATARDCLRETMLGLEAAGFDIRAHVHDEVIITEPIGGRSLEDVKAIMDRDIPWAPGLPLRGDGYECDFYQKD